MLAASSTLIAPPASPNSQNAHWMTFVQAAGVPSTYGSAQQALEAVGNGVALTDR